MENEKDSTEKKLDKVDSYLTKFGIILKKHWGKLLLILFCYCVWWAFSQPLPSEEKPIDYPAEGGIYVDSIDMEADTILRDDIQPV